MLTNSYSGSLKAVDNLVYLGMFGRMTYKEIRC